MKKAISFLISLALVLSLCMTGFASGLLAQSDSETTTEAPAETTTEAPAETTTEAPAETTTEAPAETTTEAPSETTTEAPSETTTEAPSETTTEAPTETTTEAPEETTTEDPTNPPTASFPEVTKDPTSETVRRGGYAEFVARANNCTKIVWYLQSPDGKTNVLAKDAPTKFQGLAVHGLGTERLGLENIPKSLDEWRVRAEFVGEGGNVWSAAAIIRVLDPELTAPIIRSQPKSANLNPGESASLQVSAYTTDQGTTVTYQWYSNSMNSNSGGKAILGATSATYIPTQTSGTMYYYCVVRSTNGTDISAPAKTDAVAVSFQIAQATETTQATQFTTQATETAQSESTVTLAPWSSETENRLETISTAETTAPPLARSNNLLVLIVAVIIVIAVMGIIAALVILKYYSDREDPGRPAPQPKRPAPPSKPRQAPQPPKQTFAREEDPEWDDLSDLDLSYYLDDEDDL